MTDSPKDKRIFMTDLQIACAYRLIEMYLVKDGEFYSYTLGWSDERIAEEVSTPSHPLSVHHIRPRRERDFGPLRPQYPKGSLEEQIESLRHLMVAQHDLITEQNSNIDELEGTISTLVDRIGTLETMLPALKTTAEKHRKDLEALFDKKLGEARAAFKAIRDRKEETR